MPEADELLQRFRRWLRDRHQPVTRQRDLVAQIVFGADHHLSVDEVAARLRERGHPVGLATVYRALEVMVAAGFVRAHDFGEGFKRFESIRSGQQQGHLVCSRCGQVTPFSTERLERVLPMVADEHGFQLSRHRVEIHGVCRNCRRSGIGALARAGRGR